MIIVLLIATLVMGFYFFMQTAVFGANPTGERLARIEKSANYKNGAFQNQRVTPVQSENFSVWKTMIKYFISPKTSEPSESLPSIKTDLKNLSNEQPTLIWFGHSSYFIKINGKNILVDPVFS